MKNEYATTLTAETPVQLLEVLLGLIEETEQLIADTGGQTAEKIEALGERVMLASEKLREFCGMTRQKVIVGARRVDESVRSHPYEALALALGLGLLLGALLSRPK